MDLQLTGKTAVVTGAGRGIGLAITRTLAAEGVQVIGAARRISAELARTASTAIAVDLATPTGPAQLIHSVLDRYHDIDILINNVGGGDPADLTTFDGYDDTQWQRTFELNFFSAVRACRAALPSLLRRRGVIVNISSVTARLPHQGPVPYTTAKAALTAFGKALAEEYADRGVRAVTVSPGTTRTGIWTDSDGFGATLAAAQGISHDELLADLAAASGIGSGELVEPDHVASLVAYLASPLALSATGHDYLVDGGGLKTA
jgi:NAD(P)-dependent dehydrogenase (short-subunit alcohol dehydrogenase family)